ncbi:hypothetical protein HWV62_36541 [Athelia sp. TMB]|nr:hypothetical protein HWV62_36541 [Athelia sp. TMB]
MDTSISCPNCGFGTPTVANSEYAIDKSPVRALICSNLPPATTSQLNAAQQTLQEAQRYLRDVDENISQMDAALQRLLEKRTALQNYVEAHKGIVSSLRKVPNEILSEIFIHALPPFPFKLSKNRAPLLFERVCKRWKDISRSTPTLWSYISLRYHDCNIRNIERDLKYISTCLARSGECPLSISIVGPTDFRLAAKYSEHPALAMLAAQSERWRRLILRLPMEVARKLEMVKGRLSLLSSLDLDIYQLANEDNTAVFDAFAYAPKLRHLEMSSVFLAQDVVANGVFATPRQGLTSLVVDYRDSKVIWGILRDCPSLVVLEAAIHTDNETPLQDVKLQYLQSLSLTLPSSSTMHSMLILPALTHAHFMILNPDADARLESAEPWHVLSGLDKMLSRSRCILLKLDLWDNESHLREFDLINCLKAIPSLQELILCPTLSSMLLKYALYSGGTISEIFLPNIQELVLSVRNAQPIHWLQAFDRSFRALAGHSGLIRSLKIRTDEDGLEICEELGIFKILGVLKSEGMCVKVVDHDENVAVVIL